MYIADFHVHPLYSRATSRRIDLDCLVKAAREKLRPAAERLSGTLS